MQISASKVKELRERTGAGMMECKKSLTEANGDMELAIEQMRITGLAKADKKAGNTAAEGMVVIQVTADKYAMVEINSQTDFAVKPDDFMGFANAVTEAVLNTQPASVDAISLGGKELEVVRKELVAKIGENIQVRRFVCGDSSGGTISEYSHGGGRIGVVCEIEGGDAALAKDISMHIAASSPVCIDETGVPADLLEKEKAILVAEAAESGKPPEIVEKMVAGRIKKYLADITLVGQPFVKDPDQTVGDLLKAAGQQLRCSTV